MNKLVPDKWVILKIQDKKETVLRLFSSWYGGYLYSDSWRLNSGINKITKISDINYLVQGNSSTEYIISDINYGTSSYSEGILRNTIENSKYDVTVITDVEEAIKILKEN